MTSFVLVGAGQASAVAARTLRRRGFDGRIEIVGAEPHRPYQRPPLSKEYLAAGDDDGLFLLGEEWCATNDVQLRLGVAVERIRPGRVELADGTDLTADAALIATGGRPRRLPGVDDDEVCYLRTLDDADRLRAELRRGRHVIVIGGGFVGAEVAATARAKGADVTLIEALDVPLQRALGRDMGAVCARIHRDNGVHLRLGEAVTAVSGGVVTTTGGQLEGDVVVAGLGITPNDDVAQRSGIAVDNGVLVDEFCRTGMAGVYAAGDVANHRHPLFGEHVRVEHFDNANKQGAAAAQNMLGRLSVFDDPHWFWSDQYEVNLQYTGHAPAWDELVVRGDVDGLDFCAFYLRRGVLRAAFGVERGADIMAARELVGRNLSPDVLRDEDVDLMELAMLEQA
ncbi:MAG TPA: FAD-dependent oxidoreductase [Jatrophihabitantaceae bacterium]|jgi:3-phenylpropionate/trans-cinnamate dioxygenase ferredoxin reductase subunit